MFSGGNGLADEALAVHGVGGNDQMLGGDGNDRLLGEGGDDFTTGPA